MRPLLAILLLAASSTPAFAHALHVDCRLRGDRVTVEAFYDGNEPAEKAIVKVLNQEKQVVCTGSTDKEGAWSFARPAPGKYVVLVNAGAGHRREEEIEVPAQRPSSAIEGTSSSNLQEDSDGKRTDVGRPDGTPIPWLRIAIGLAVIGALGGAFLLASMLRKKTLSEPEA